LIETLLNRLAGGIVGLKPLSMLESGVVTPMDNDRR
jgi:hypothetical protein